MSFKTNFSVTQLLNTLDLEGISEKDLLEFYVRDGTLFIITKTKSIEKPLWKNKTNSLEKVGLKY